MSKLENKILTALDEIRPFLVQDGGDISLSSIAPCNSTLTVDPSIEERDISPPSWTKKGLISSNAVNILFSNFDIIS